MNLNLRKHIPEVYFLSQSDKVGIVHQDDHAGLDQGAGFLAFDQAQTFGAGLGDGGHQFGAGRHGQFDLVIDGAGTHGADGAPESIASAGFHIFSPYVGGRLSTYARGIYAQGKGL